MMSRHSSTSGTWAMAASKLVKRSGVCWSMEMPIRAIRDRPSFFGVQLGPVAGDEACLLQGPHPAQAGGGGEADAVGQVLVADASVLLQQLQYLAVVAVDFHKIPGVCECVKLLLCNR